LRAKKSLLQNINVIKPTNIVNVKMCFINIITIIIFEQLFTSYTL